MVDKLNPEAVPGHDGMAFRLGNQNRKLFGLLDAPPCRQKGDSTYKAEHRANRKMRHWVFGEKGVQIAWTNHGLTRILLLDNGLEIAVALNEAEPVPQAPADKDDRYA